MLPDPIYPLERGVLEKEPVETPVVDDPESYEIPVDESFDWEIPLEGGGKPKQEYETAFVADKSLVVGMPKGKDLDEINMGLLTTIYHNPKEPFWGGVDVGAAIKNNVGALTMVPPIGVGAVVADVAAQKFPVLNQFSKGAYADLLYKPIAIGGLMKEQSYRMSHPVTLENIMSGDVPVSDILQRTALYGVNHMSGNLLSRKLDEYGGRLIDAAQNTIVRQKIEAGETFPEQLAFGLGQGTMSALTSIGIAYATRNPLLVGALFGIQQKGAKYVEMTERGIDPERASTVSTLYAIPEAGLEYLGLDVFMNYLRGSKVFARIFGRSATEAIQEALQQGSEGIIDKYFGGRPELQYSEIASQMGFAALIGGLVGMPAGVSTTFLEENTALGQIRKEFNLTDPETQKVADLLNQKVKDYAGEKIATILDQEASKLELNNAETEAKQKTPEQVAGQVFTESLVEQQKQMLETLRAELEANSINFSEQELEEFRGAIDEQLAALPGAKPEVRYSRPQGENRHEKMFSDLKKEFGSVTNIETDSGVKVKVSVDAIGRGGLEIFERTDADNNVVYIDSIESSQKGKGNASKVLDRIIEIADKNQVELRLFPRIYKKDAGQMELPKLYEWYQRKGFVPDEEGMMSRKPTPVVAKELPIRYSRSPNGGMKANDLQALVDKLYETMKNLPAIAVVQGLDQAKSYFPVQFEDAEGFYDPNTNTVVLIADNIADEARANFVILHEVVGHYGLSGIFEKEKLSGIMKEIYESSPEIKKAADERMKQSGYTLEVATEDVIADMAANPAENMSVLKKTIAIIRNALRGLGVNIAFSDDDIALILANARRYVEEEVPLEEKRKYKSAKEKQKDFEERQIKAQVARDELRDLLVLKRSLKGKVKRYDDGFMDEEIDKVPKYFISKSGMHPDELVSEINETYGLNLDGMDALLMYLSRIPEREAQLRQTIKDAVPERFTVSEAQVYKERERVAEAKRKAVTAAKESAQKKINALKEKIVNLKAMSAEQREAIRAEMRQRLADQKMHLTFKIKQGNIKRRDLELYIRENLPITRRGRYLRLVARTTSNTDMAKAFGRITKGIDDYQKDVVTVKIEKVLKIAETSSKVAVEYKQMIRDIGAMFSPTTPRASTLRSLKATQQYIKDELAAGRVPEIPIYVYESLSRLQQVPYDSLSVAELQNIYDRLETLIQLGVTKLKARKNIYAALQQNRLSQLVGGTQGWRTGAITEEDTGVGLKPNKLTGRQQIRNWLVNSLNAARIAKARTLPMDVVFDILDGNQNYQGPNYRIFKKEFDAAFGRYLKMRDEVAIRITDLAKELKLDDQNFKRIGIYAADVQEGGREKLLAGKISEADILSLYPGGKNALTASEIKFYEAMRQELNNLRPLIADVMKEVHNQELGMVKDYFPFMIDFDAMADSEIEKFFGVDIVEYTQKPRKNVEAGFTKDRVGGKLKIRLNAMQVFLQHLDNAAYLVQCGGIIRQLSELAQSDQYGEAAGDIGQRMVVEWTDILARKGAAKGSGAEFIKAMNVFRKNVGALTLGFRLTSTLIQPTALFDAAAIIGPYAFKGARNVADWTERGQAWRKFLIDNFPDLKARVGDDPNYLDFGGRSTMDQIARAGFWALKELDMLTAMSATAGAYQKIVEAKGKKVDLSKPDKDAVLEADRILRRTQSSAFFKDSPLAISQGIMGVPGLGKLVWQFQNFMLNRWSLIEHDLLANGFKRGQIGAMLNGFAFLTIAIAAETFIRRGTKEILDALIELITGEEPETYRDVTFFQDMAENAIQAIPLISPMLYELGLMDQITGSEVPGLPSGQIPVPTLKAAQTFIKEVGATFSVEEPGKKVKHAIKAAAYGLGMKYGIAGTSQTADILGKVAENVL